MALLWTCNGAGVRVTRDAAQATGHHTAAAAAAGHRPGLDPNPDPNPNYNPNPNHSPNPGPNPNPNPSPNPTPNPTPDQVTDRDWVVEPEDLEGPPAAYVRKETLVPKGLLTTLLRPATDYRLPTTSLATTYYLPPTTYYLHLLLGRRRYRHLRFRLGRRERRRCQRWIERQCPPTRERVPLG